MKTVEILVNTEYGWCLDCIANEDNCQTILAERQKAFPNKEFKIEASSKDAWYKQGCLD